MSLTPAENYLENSVRIIIEPLITSTLNERPEEPIIYMIEWLNKLNGKFSTRLKMEKEELASLRREIKKFNRKKLKEDVEMIVSTDSDKEDDEEQDKIDELILKRKIQNLKKGGRSSVSAEAYGIFNKKEIFIPKIIHKTDDQRNKIHSRISQSFIFNSLDEKDLITVINAMEEKRFKEKDYIIKQGENGDVLYLVEFGNLDCFKTFVNKNYFIFF